MICKVGLLFHHVNSLTIIKYGMNVRGPNRHNWQPVSGIRNKDDQLISFWLFGTHI